MKKILLTGGSGFIGRNIIPFLKKKYEVFAPSRQELNINDQQCVENWLDKKKVDILIHCAITNPFNILDHERNIISDTLKSFLCLSRYPFEKIFYIGSGAEYDKSKDIINVSEEDIGKSIPKDEYGLAKYVLNEIARLSENIINLRVFGCYGPSEPERRFIRHAVDCCLKNLPISIRQDCFFSYVFVNDLARFILYILEKETKYNDYNVCLDTAYRLSDIAEIVKKQMNCSLPIQFLKDGLGKEYTGSNSRIKNEFPDFRFTSIDCGISEQIKWQRNI